MQQQSAKSVREVFQLSWLLYRRRFRFLMGAAAFVLFPFAIASTYVRTHFLMMSQDQMNQLLTDVKGSDALSSNQLLSALPPGAEIWYAVLTVLYIFLVFPLLFGMITRMTTEQMVIGERVSVSEAGNASFRRIFTNIGALLLVTVGYLLAVTIYSLILGVITSLLSSIAPPLAFIVAIIGSIALIIGIVWYMTRMVFIPAIIVEEGKNGLSAFRRALQLAQGETRRLVGFFVMLLLVCFVVQTFMTLIGDAIFPGPGAQLLVSVVVTMAITPFAYVAIAMMYLEMRIRKGE